MAAVLLFLCAFGIFAGFLIAGKVDHAGAMIGINISTGSLIGFAALGIYRWYEWRKLPQYIRNEWRYGKLIDCDDAPMIKAPLIISDKTFSLNLTAEALGISRSLVIKTRGDFFSRPEIKGKSDIIITWGEILEIEVCDDNDSYNYYKINLNSGDSISVRRVNRQQPPEHFILDAFRSIGKVPIRLKCDVE